MPDPGLLDVLRRSGGLVAVARQLDVAPPVVLAASTALLPLVRAGFRRDVEQAESLAAAAQSEIPAETVAQVLPLLAMLAGGYVSARAGRMSATDCLAELGPLLDLAGEPNPLDALAGIADD